MKRTRKRTDLVNGGKGKKKTTTEKVNERTRNRTD